MKKKIKSEKCKMEEKEVLVSVKYEDSLHLKNILDILYQMGSNGVDTQLEVITITLLLKQFESEKVKELWVTGHAFDHRLEKVRETVPKVAWELVGIFDSEEKSVKACLDDLCFVGPVTLNNTSNTSSHESISWPRCYYPLAPKLRRIFQRRSRT